ncbi:chemotaxis protein CheW [Citreimonas salinaria]|uniref:Purine-binding chemotaxis protein CheW n=1 Tax=Citreimonas salinaria TaxID=321339 RepID=A0A1H3MRP3_9RHOB|nr:chemotaxis protein CheW [Citreimonas salinaria]SDY79276.1 purine-binding chemotaxis protein CheW [Citreimonas salinaria]
MTETSEIEGMALTFSLQGETFAIPVTYVDEIIDPLPVTRAPNADAFAPGLINVRGAIAPFVDLRHRLGMKPAGPCATSRVLVLDLVVGGESTKVAMMADAVDDITETNLSDLEPVPELGVRWPTEYLKGVAKKDGALIILLDVEATFAPTTSH